MNTNSCDKGIAYLYIAYLGNPPELDGETEAELPEFLQDDDA